MNLLSLKRLSTPRRSLAWAVLYSLLLQMALPAAPLFAVSRRPLLMPVAAVRALPATQAAAPASIVLQEVVHDVNDLAAIAEHATSNTLLAAVDDASAKTLELIDAAAARRSFSTLAGIESPVVATSATGQIYVASGASIARVSPDGTVAGAFVTLAGETAIAALHVDRTLAWGGDLLAVTVAGAVWRVSATGTATRVGTIGKPASSVITIPPDEGRYGAWAGAILVAARDEAKLYTMRAAGAVEAFPIGVIARDLALAAAHKNFYGLDRTAGVIRAARAEAFAEAEGDVIVAQHAPGVLARVRWNGTEFVTIRLAETTGWDRIAFAAAGIGAIPAARRIYDAVAVVRHAPLLESGRIEGALWQLTPESVTLDGTDVITSDLLIPGTPSVVIGSGKPSFGGVIAGSDSAEPKSHKVTIAGNASLRHLVTRTDAITLPAVIPPPAPAGTRDVTLTSPGTAGDFATLRNLSISGKAGEVTVPAGTYGQFTAIGRTTLVFGAAGTASTYNLTRLDLSGGSELRIHGDVTVNLRDGLTVTGSSAGAADAPKRLILNVASGDLNVSGTGVLNALVRAPGSLVAIDGNGLLRGSVGADRLSISGNGILQVTQTDVPPPPTNRPPTVDAGADQTLTLPANTLRLEGSVTDDGLPRNAQLTAKWTLVSGPADVTFADAATPQTNAQFTLPGTYVLRLSADDSALRTTDEVTVTVIPENDAPTVDAGDDQRIELPNSATLHGTATDDGLPSGSTLATTWSVVSGGSVVFADPASAGTTATFTAPGVYVLRLTASDTSVMVTDDVTVTVDPANEAPVVSAGADQTIQLPAGTTLSGNASDDGQPRGSVLMYAWTQVSGPGVATFEDAAKAVTTATFSAAGTYVLRLTVSDSAAEASDDVTIVVRPENRAPAVDAGADQTIELPNIAALTATVNDDDGEVVTLWSKVSGPGTVTFANAAAAQTTASFSAAGVYVLAITAADSQLTATDELTITVLLGNRAPVVSAGADQTIQLPATATLNGTATDDGKPANQLTYAWSAVSGGNVQFSNANAVQTVATFAAAGTYVLRLTVSDGELSASDELTVVAKKANEAPVVDAGADQTVDVAASASLNGHATDDGLPGGPLSYAWTRVSGPGAVSFSQEQSASTFASFGSAGVYVLRLTVSDSLLSASDDVTIVVKQLPSAAFTVPGSSHNALTLDNNVASRAEGASVVSASSTAGGTAAPESAIDDNGSSQWRSAAGQVAQQTLVVQLSRVRTIDRIRILNGTGTEAVKNFRVDVSATTSDDAAFRTVLADLLTDTARVQEFELAPAAARYLRFTAIDNHGGTAVALRAFETIDSSLGGITSYLGVPNVAASGQGAVASANSGVSQSANDGLLTTSWVAFSSPVNQPLTIRLAQVYSVDRIRLANLADTRGVRDFRIETSNDGVAYTAAFTGTAANAGGLQAYSFPAVRTRWVRLVALNNYGHTTSVGLAELEIGTTSTGAAAVSHYSDHTTRPEMLIDNLASTYWTSAAGEQRVTLRISDEPRLVEAFVLRSPDGLMNEVVKDFELLGSSTTADAAAFTTILTGTAAAVALPQTFALPGGPRRLRYVTFVIKSNYGSTFQTRVAELQLLTRSSDGNVIGTPLPPVAVATGSPALLVNGAAVVASSSALSGSTPELMLDYIHSTPWRTTGTNAQFAVIRLSAEVRLTAVQLTPRTDVPDTTESVKDFEIWVSTTTADAQAFTRVLTGTVSTQKVLQTFAIPGGPVSARFVKYVPLTNYGATTIATGAFDVVTDVETGGAIAASSAASLALRVERATDRDGSTSWRTPSGSVANQWLKIAVPATTTQYVYGLNITPESNLAPRDFEVRVSDTTSDDAAFRTIYSGTMAAFGISKFLFNQAPRARYVQLFFKSGYATQIGINTAEILTLPADGSMVTGISSNSAANFDPSTLLDLSTTNLPWTTASGQAAPHYLTVALPPSRTWLIDHIMLQQRTPCCLEDTPRDFDLFVSADEAGETFALAMSGTMRNNGVAQHFFFPAVTARHLRLVLKNNWSTFPTTTLQKFHAFSPQTGGVASRFLDASSSPAAPVAAYHWEFGDGATSSERDPEHLYGAPGAYDVSLTITDATGEQSRRTIAYSAAATAADFTFGPDNATEGVDVIFTDTSASPSTKREWQWRDGSLPTLDRSPAPHRFTDNGQFDVTLTTYGPRGVPGSVTKRVTVVNAPPSISTAPTAIVLFGDPFLMTPSLSDPGTADLDSLRCRWDFGDGRSDDVPNCNLKTVSHVYDTIGIFDARLTVTDKDGGSATRTIVVTVRKAIPTLVYSGSRTFVPNEPVQLRAVLRDLTRPVFLGGRTVMFDVDGQTVSAVANSDGIAQTTLVYHGTTDAPLITVRFAGDTWYEPAITTVRLAPCPPQKQPLDIALVFDRSGSMAQYVQDQTHAAKLFLDQLDPAQDQVAVMALDVTTKPLTRDYAAVRVALDTLTGSSSEVAEGIERAKAELTSVRRNPFAAPVMIIFADGITGNDGTPARAAAAAAKSGGIRIVSIAMSPDANGKLLLRDVASSGDDFHTTTSSAELDAIYSAIASSLCTAANTAPVVSAGSPAAITLPSDTVALEGAVVDDGLPANAAVTSQWTKVSGPGTVTFANAAAPATTVRFSTDGVYVLRLTATDTQYSRSSDVTITVHPRVNLAPSVDAGADVTIVAPVTSVTLNGTASDDGLPAGSTLTLQWTQLSGPAASTISSPAAATTSVTFPRPGVYVLRLTATDGALASTDDVTVHYDAVNEAPVVNAGADQTVTLGAPLQLGATVSDDGLPLGGTLTLAWAKVSGPGEVTFTDPTAIPTAVTFGAAGTYVLALSAHDGAASGSDSVTIVVNAPQPPASVEITAPADGILLAGSTDVSGSVSHGNWRLEYALNDQDGGAAQQWTRFASGTGAAAGVLGRFDASLLLNGIYGIRLVSVTEDGQTSMAAIAVEVFSKVKPGEFALRFSDVAVASEGLPIEVVRSYTTADPRRGDFGHGWSLSIRDIRIEKTTQIGRSWEYARRDNGVLPKYCIEATRPHNVSVTFPNGLIYKFRAMPSPTCQDATPARLTTVTFEQIPTMAGTAGAALQAVDEGSDAAVVGDVPGLAQLMSLVTGSPYNPTVFRLTTLEGWVYTVSQTAGTQSVRDPNGNTLIVDANGIRGTLGDGVAFERDALGRITTIRDGNGESLQYHYDTNGDLITFVDRNGDPTYFTYDAHRMLTMTDARGKDLLQATYDAQGRLATQTNGTDQTLVMTHDPATGTETITEPDGETLRLVYDLNGNVLSETNRAGAVTTYTYDARGNRLTKKDALGAITNYTYDANDRLLTESDALGTIATRTYDAKGRPLTTVDADGGISETTYDSAGNILTMRDPAGATTTYTYDAKGRRVTEKNALGCTRTYDYDMAGNVMREVDFNGRVTTYTYDGNGNRLTETTSRTVGTAVEQLVTTHTYDNNGRRLSTTRPDGAVERVEYDAAGQKIAETDPLGHTLRYTYDDAGRLPKTTYPDGSTSTSTYNDLGRVETTVDRDGRSVTLEYDLAGRMSRTTRADGTTTSMTYDAAGRLLTRKDERGHVSTMEYDSRGRLLKTINALGDTATNVYDGRGNRTSTTDANGHTTRFEYDGRNRLTKEIQHDGRFRTIEYDLEGRKRKETDAAGASTSYDYDCNGRVTTITDAMNGVTRLTYDEVGNLLTQTDAENRTTTFAYDKLGRKTKRILPLGQVESWTYDADGNVATHKRPNGTGVTHEYDSSHHLIRRAAAGSEVTYAYTPGGSRTSMTDSRGTTTFGRDGLGRLTLVTEPDGRTIAYTYDAAHNRTSRSTASRTLTYTYDELNRMSSVISPEGTTTYSYDDAGNRIGQTNANGTRVEYIYDTSNRLTDVKHRRADGTAIAGYHYTLGAAGNRLRLDEESGHSVTYAYDALYRLTSETSAQGVVEYTYDHAGNRLTKTENGITTMYAYDANDRMTAEGAAAWTYDDSGNALTRTVAGAQTTYEYDPWDRMVEATSPDGVLKYGYDGDDLRVSSTAAGATSSYLWDRTPELPVVVAEYRDGAAVAEYTHGDELLGMTRGGASFVYHTDGQLSTRVLTDAQQAVTDTWAYTAFGELAGRTGTTPNDFLYTGQQYDPNAGFYYLRARWYAPSIGRFVTEDSYTGSIFEPETLHRYVYTTNNPVTLFDPSGHMGTLAELSASMEMMSVMSNYYPIIFKSAAAMMAIDVFMRPGFAMQGCAMALAPFAESEQMLRGIYEMYEYGGLLVNTGAQFVHTVDKAVDVAVNITHLTSASLGLANIAYSMRIGLGVHGPIEAMELATMEASHYRLMSRTRGLAVIRTSLMRYEWDEWSERLVEITRNVLEWMIIGVHKIGHGGGHGGGEGGGEGGGHGGEGGGEGGGHH